MFHADLDQGHETTVRSSKICFPEGLAKEIPNIVKIAKCWDLIDCAMVLPMISTCKFIAKHTPDAFEHFPDLFCKAPGPEKKV